jgi:hypothetical protein
LNHLTLPVGTSVLVLVLVGKLLRKRLLIALGRVVADPPVPRLMVFRPVTRRRRVVPSRRELPWSGA